MTASVTNPFLQVFPRTPLKRIFNTLGDIEVFALVSSKLAKLTGDERFNDYWKFVNEGNAEAYLQRILDFSTNAKGYRIDDLIEKANQGVPALMNNRTNPKAVGYPGSTLFELAEAGERVLGWRPEEPDYACPNTGEDDCAGQVDGGADVNVPHLSWFFYLARICNHCTYPACLSACRDQSPQLNCRS